MSGCWAGVCRRGRAWQFQRQLLESVALLSVAFQMASCCIEPVSRRACNSSYVLWSVSLSLQLLSVLVLLLPTGQDKQAIPVLMMLINNCLMPVFLSSCSDIHGCPLLHPPTASETHPFCLHSTMQQEMMK